jgi:pimeloyl-ACP methyl ester carboxylesterase
MKYSILFFIILAAFTQSAAAQQKHNLASDWKGYININGKHLIQKVHIKKQKTGYSGTLDVPQQGAKGLPLNKISITKKDSVFFQFNGGGTGIGKFKGHFESDSTITGSFHQGGYTFPFKLKRYTPKVVKQKPKPYHHKDIIIQKNDSIQIGGTLTWPKHKKANQLVIMTTGSGAENRDEEIFGFKIFGQIADYLTRHAIATFRYDDRGVGESTGTLHQTSLSTLASDVESIVAYFSNPAHHHFNTITLLGHSGGGEIDGMAAARDTLVDKLILMSSPGISLNKVLNYEFKRSFTRSGFGKPEIEKTLTAFQNVLIAIRNSENVEKAKKHYRKQFTKMFNTMPDSIKKHMKNFNKTAKKAAAGLLKNLTTPKYNSQMFYDPANDLKQLHIPVLATFGGKDTQVLIGKNLLPISAALNSAGVSYQINVFKNADHLYQPAKSMKDENYAMLPKHFVKGFLPTITEWLKRTGEAK